MTKTVLALSVFLAVSSALAQSGTQSPPAPPARKALTFDVVTIKPSARTDGAWRLQPTPDGYTGMDISLRHLVSEAYGVFDSKLLIGGPSWIDKTTYDLEAKFDPATVPDPKSLTYRQRADMLRAVLADRFQLKVHFEKREFPAYDLVIAKGGPKLAETSPEKLSSMTGSLGLPSCLFTRSRGGLMGVEGCTMQSLAGSLLYSSGRTVIDKTGLTGRYTFTLRWTPENAPADSSLADRPSIFTALQEQLGLKLEPSTAPLDVLVIDSAEPPTPN